MKCFIITALLAFTEAGVINTLPRCITIRNIKYEEQILKDNLNAPYQLTVDYGTNTLFFSSTAIIAEGFKIAYLNLNSNDYGLVTGIKNGFASAVNDLHHIVYLGGQDGIYKFNYDTKSATKINTNLEVSIWQMFYKDGLYFSTYPDEKVFLYKNQEVHQVPELKHRAMVLGIKKDGSYVYSNSSGLFIHNKATGNILKAGDYTVNGITSDINGNIYFSTPFGIYHIDDEKNEIEKLFSEENIYGVAIDGNGNIIYATDATVKKLKPSKGKCLNNEVL